MKPVRTMAVDAGATNVRVGFARGEAMEAPLPFLSQEHPSLAAILQEAVAKRGGEPVDAACVGLAGPVRRGRCRLTHVRWPEVRRADLESLLKAPVHLLNDAEAQAWAVATLLQPTWGPRLDAQRDLVRLHGGSDEAADQVVVVTVGTGLGVALLARPEGEERYRVVRSEAGHVPLGASADLAPLADLAPHATWEDVASGRGFGVLYRHEARLDPGREDAEVTAAVARAGLDAGRIVGMNAAKGDVLCRRAHARFWDACAAFASAMALAADAGRVMLCGGAALAGRAHLDAEAFARRFEVHPRKGEILKAVPVDLVTREHLGLLGAHARAQALA